METKNRPIVPIVRIASKQFSDDWSDRHDQMETRLNVKENTFRKRMKDILLV